MAVAILVIKDLANDSNLNESSETAAKDKCVISARYWPIEHKEKLFSALLKVFSLNMPLYLAYKHLMISHDRYSILRDCTCFKLSNETISLIHLYCQSNNKNNSQVGKYSSQNKLFSTQVKNKLIFQGFRQSTN